MNKIKLINKYKPLFTSPSRYYIVTGGRGSSKSYSIATWLCMLMHFESGHVILFTRYTLTSAHASIIPEFVGKLEELGLLDSFEITNTEIISRVTGSRIMFKGLKASSGIQTANLKSLTDVTTWVMDEAEELVDEELADKIDLSIRKKGKQNRVIFIMNPSTKEHWIYQRYFQDKGVEAGTNGDKEDTTYIHTTYLDNLKHLDASFVNKVESLKTKNKIKYDHIVMGGWLDKAEGVIFTDWEFGSFDESLSYGYACDWGFSPDPTSFNRIAIDQKQKIIYVEEIAYKTEMGMDEIYETFKIAGNKEIVSEYAGQGSIINAELKRKGLNIVPCIKGADSVEEGIRMLQEYKLIITPESTNTARELNNYVWSNKKAGVPRDLYNHSIDNIRYYLMKQITKPKIKKFYVR